MNKKLEDRLHHLRKHKGKWYVMPRWVLMQPTTIYAEKYYISFWFKKDAEKAMYLMNRSVLDGYMIRAMEDMK